ncbi:MAG: ATP-dependent RNA helicase HrpA [Verrucomicrobiota bacterium]
MKRPGAQPTLPIHAHRMEIARAVRDHPVVIVCGDTGSGKTTQLPQICLDHVVKDSDRGRIGCTQPRRLAAVTVATRVADERKATVGREVGYQVRFDDRTSRDTRLKFMTDGILLAETQGDRDLRQYSILIIDEAHERSLNIDFLLGYLKNLLARRPDLRVIISSATLDTEQFSSFFNEAPTISVEGRTFPVEDHDLRPWDHEDLPSHVARAVEWVRDLDREGDILVFLPGEREIRDVEDVLIGRQFPGTEILPLFARLGLADQQRIFKKSSRQRIVLATNVAETSLTIPNIVYVIDSGLARVSRFNAASRVQRLQTEFVSQANARQRRGRCGRVSEGVCVRLYTQEDLDKRPEYTDPEIRRSSLAGVILKMVHLGLPAIEQFPFIDPPQKNRITEGYRTLQQIAALDDKRRLTQLGTRIASFPIDPQLARMLIYAEDDDSGTLNQLIIITSALTIQDPRERPAEKQAEADEAQKSWRDDRSDFLLYLHLWADLEPFFEKPRKIRKNQLRRFAKRHFLSFRRLLEWLNLYWEVCQVLKHKPQAASGRDKPGEGDYEPIHLAILSGIPHSVAQSGPKPRAYKTSGEKELYLFPGSGLAKRKKAPAWIMTFEVVETSRLFARKAAEMKPEWLEKVAPHLCRSQYFEPHWNPQQGAVYSKENVSCSGFKIIAGRRVHFGRINPTESRKIFIWEALTTNQVTTNGAFKRHNTDLLEQLKAREQKHRQPDSLIFPQAIFDFFDERLPPEIHTAKAFERWRSKAEQGNSELLYLTEESATYHRLEPLTDDGFPDFLDDSEGISYPLYYQYGELWRWNSVSK